MKKYLWAILWLILASMQIQSAEISVDATGIDSANIDFWGVSFDSGNGFIESVEFDLSPLSALGIGFDFDQASLPQLTSPVIGSLSGLSAQEINADFNGLDPTVFSFTFEPNTFSAGDAFRFTADTDYFSSPIPGHIHGLSTQNLDGLLFTVTMEDGSTVSDNFIISNLSFDNTSQSGITVTTASAVPLPAAVWLFGTGMLVVRIDRKKTPAVQS
ncbi:MAG: hypothetical protein V3V18_00035 [Methylococcales bacterium]